MPDQTKNNAPGAVEVTAPGHLPARIQYALAMRPVFVAIVVTRAVTEVDLNRTPIERRNLAPHQARIQIAIDKMDSAITTRDPCFI